MKIIRRLLKKKDAKSAPRKKAAKKPKKAPPARKSPQAAKAAAKKSTRKAPRPASGPKKASRKPSSSRKPQKKRAAKSPARPSRRAPVAKPKTARAKKAARAAGKKPARSAPKTASRKAKRPPKAARKARKRASKTTAMKRTPKSGNAAKKPVQKKRAARHEAFVERMTSLPSSQKKELSREALAKGADSARITACSTILKGLLKKGTITAWRINFARTRSMHRYFGRNLVPEDSLTSEREDLSVTIYHKNRQGMGDATIPLLTADPNEMRRSLEEATALLSLTRKPAYDLPEPEERESAPQGADEAFWDALWDRDPSPIDSLEEESKKLLANEQVSSYEILGGAHVARVLTSSGIDASWHKTSVHLSLALSAKAGEREDEFFWESTVASPVQLSLASTLPRQALIAREAVSAGPCESFTGDVLIAGRSLTDFFVPLEMENPLVVHAAARIHAMGLSSYKLGEPIGEFKGEPFTITSDPHLQWGLLTQPVDEEGVALRPVDLIRTGIFTQMLTTPRYAPLVGEKVTGQMSNLHIAEGATREEHLRGNNYVEIVSFSWFNPDPISGDFSAEIRLGYRWIRGKRTTFRGGTFTGNVFENLRNARFSREVMQSGRYYGPRAVLFKDARIVKQA